MAKKKNARERREEAQAQKQEKYRLKSPEKPEQPAQPEPEKKPPEPPKPEEPAVQQDQDAEAVGNREEFAPDPVTTPRSEAERRALHERRREARISDYKTMGYEPTHEVCSLLGYLIGVDDRYFSAEEHEFLRSDIFEQANRRNNLKVVRLLCTVRNRVMRQYPQFDRVISEGSGIRLLLPDGILDILHRNGYDCSLGNKRSAAEYLLLVNDKLKKALDKAKPELSALLPNCVNPGYIQNLIPFPGSIKKAADVNTLQNRYYQNQLKYPYKCYLNIDPGMLPPGNPFAGDDEIVRCAYACAGQEFHDIWKLRIPCHDVGTVDTLHRFLDPAGHYSFLMLIDGVSVRVDEVIALLEQLSEQELEAFAHIYLFCCSDVIENWKFYLGSYQDYLQFIEVSSDANDPERADDIGINMALNTFGLPGATAVVLVTRNPGIFKECHQQAETAHRALCVLTDRYADSAILDTLCKNHIAYGLLQDLPTGTLSDRKQYAWDRIREQFPLELVNARTLNARTLIEEQLNRIPVAYTKEERETLFQELARELHLQIEPDGTLKLAL